MLKVLKWAYDLGVRQERIRIAAHLQLEGQRSGLGREQAEFMIRDNRELKSFKEKRQRQLELDVAVNNRVQRIIDEMFTPIGGWVTNQTSTMFPDDEHHGEIK